MKERPILFSGPMVRAILDGKKTQTRRVVKSRLTKLVDEVFRVNGHWTWDTTDYDFRPLSPYGAPGDRLWVRETFTRHEDESGFGSGVTLYRADMKDCEIAWTWTPSIFMPRHASRITLEVNAVRVERLHDISHEECIKEGMTSDDNGWWGAPGGSRGLLCTDPKYAYKEVWDSINGKDAWKQNPWVWVIEFKRI